MNYRPSTDQVPPKYPLSKSLKNIFKQTHGGKRLNAGSKPKYNEPTKTTAFRIPISKIDEVKKLVRDFLAGYERENNQ
jgi:hypothetical protein